MRRSFFVGVLTLVFVSLMSSTALAHVCFVDKKPEGSGSAGSATVILDVAIDPSTGVETEFDETFIPGPDFEINEKNGRFKGGFLTLTFEVTLYDTVIGGTVLGSETRTADVFVQNTVGGGAHFAGPGDFGCDGVGMDSLEACVMEALLP